MNIKKILGIIMVALLVWYVGLPLLGFGASLVFYIAKIILTVAVAIFMIYLAKELVTKVANKR